MGRIVQRKFSGYAIDYDEVPKGLRIRLRDVRTNRVWDMEDTQYWMRQNLASFYALIPELKNQETA